MRMVNRFETSPRPPSKGEKKPSVPPLKGDTGGCKKATPKESQKKGQGVPPKKFGVGPSGGSERAGAAPKFLYTFGTATRPSCPSRGIALLLFLFLALNLYPQNDYPYATEHYPFVRYDLNELQFPGTDGEFQGIYQKIDRLLFQGEGQIQIVHIGGSHIQADMWSDRMRQRLQTFFPGVRGSRGLLFPFKMARTNNPYNYKPEFTGNWDACRCVTRATGCSLGLTGISVTTRDTLTTLKISFRGEDYPQYAFNRVRVFHDMVPESFEAFLPEGAPEHQRAIDQSGGATVFRLNQHENAIELEFRKTGDHQDHFTLHGIALESDDPGFIYHAIGVNGAATSSYLRCSLFTQHMAAISPDLVVFSIGINDANGPNFDQARYERNYDKLIARVKEANPNAAILFTTNNDSYYKRRYPNKNAEKVRAAMLRLAEKHGAAVWDMYGVMGGLGSIKKWETAGLANRDKIHLLKPGYIHVADLMFNALMKSYDDHLRASAKTRGY